MKPRETGPASRILVLGGGAQGRVIATDLARALPAARISVADIARPELPDLPNLSWMEADMSDSGAVVRALAGHDMGVGALPSRFGFAAMKAAIEAGRDMVDVSFSAEDPLELDAAARRAGVSVLPDCGLAPGISNLLSGVAAARGRLDELTIYVGGVAQDSSRPYGYVVTWSLDDLLEEYTRPARIVSQGCMTTVPVFSGHERLRIEGVGELEAFYSDGLRTLLHTLPDVPDMGEKTLRWPGHAEAVQPLLREGRLVEELRARCTERPANDLVVLRVAVRARDRKRAATLISRFDPVSGLTAMARTTALTCATVARLVALGGVNRPGVLPLERLASADAHAADFVLQGLRERGVDPVWKDEDS